jgi:hypothetical protein
VARAMRAGPALATCGSPGGRARSPGVAAGGEVARATCVGFALVVGGCLVGRVGSFAAARLVAVAAVGVVAGGVGSPDAVAAAGVARATRAGLEVADRLSGSGGGASGGGSGRREDGGLCGAGGAVVRATPIGLAVAAGGSAAAPGVDVVGSAGGAAAVVEAREGSGSPASRDGSGAGPAVARATRTGLAAGVSVARSDLGGAGASVARVGAPVRATRAGLAGGGSVDVVDTGGEGVADSGRVGDAGRVAVRATRTGSALADGAAWAPVARATRVGTGGVAPVDAAEPEGTGDAETSSAALGAARGGSDVAGRRATPSSMRPRRGRPVGRLRGFSVSASFGGKSPPLDCDPPLGCSPSSSQRTASSLNPRISGTGGGGASSGAVGALRTPAREARRGRDGRRAATGKQPISERSAAGAPQRQPPLLDLSPEPCGAQAAQRPVLAHATTPVSHSDTTSRNRRRSPCSRSSSVSSGQ